jgi:type I restriction enzyme, S subunit
MIMMKRVKLGELFKVSKGKKYNEVAFEDSKHRYISIEDLHGGKLPKYTNEKGVEVTETDVLIAWDGANAGKMGVGFTGVIGSTLARLRPTSEAIHSRFAFWFLESSNELIKSQRVGATIPHINGITLREIEIPLPPLPVQQQIAAILDKADALRRKDRELLKQYDALAQAIFMDMFGDPVRNEKGWLIGSIRDMSSEVKYGTSSPAEPQGDYIYLRMNNITYEGAWDFKDLKYISISNQDKPKYVLKKHDLVFNRTNSKELVGKTAVYDQEKEVIIAGYLIRVRTNALGNPYYISGFLNSKMGKSILFNMCKSIIGMANINAQELQNIQLPIPPIALQNDYQIRIEAIKTLKYKVLEAQQQSETLFQSLLQQAFEGSLVK